MVWGRRRLGCLTVTTLRHRAMMRWLLGENIALVRQATLMDRSKGRRIRMIWNIGKSWRRHYSMSLSVKRHLTWILSRQGLLRVGWLMRHHPCHWVVWSWEHFVARVIWISAQCCHQLHVLLLLLMLGASHTFRIGSSKLWLRITWLLRGLCLIMRSLRLSAWDLLHHSLHLLWCLLHHWWIIRMLWRVRHVLEHLLLMHVNMLLGMNRRGHSSLSVKHLLLFL